MNDENGYGRGIQGRDPPEDQRSPSPECGSNSNASDTAELLPHRAM